MSRTQLREAISIVCTGMQSSERKACQFIGMARSVFRHKSRIADIELREKIRELAQKHRRWGYRQIARKLRKELVINVKRVYRLYTEMGLKYRTKQRKKHLFLPRTPLVVPQKPGLRWSMDFMCDALANRRRFRIFNIIDDCSREAVAQFVSFSITAKRVVEVLERLASSRGLPEQIVIDNGCEFTSNAFRSWAARNNVALHFIDKGKPTQNAFIESFNGKFRNECLNEHWFESIEEARIETEKYRNIYNQERPHSSLNGLTPHEYLRSVA